jgi:hypothetical protein
MHSDASGYRSSIHMMAGSRGPPCSSTASSVDAVASTPIPNISCGETPPSSNARRVPSPGMTTTYRDPAPLVQGGVVRLELYVLGDNRRPLPVEDAHPNTPVPISVPSRYRPSAVDPDFISAIARIYADLQAGSFAVRLPGFLKPSDGDTMRDDRPPVYAAGGKQS